MVFDEVILDLFPLKLDIAESDFPARTMFSTQLLPYRAVCGLFCLSILSNVLFDATTPIFYLMYCIASYIIIVCFIDRWVCVPGVHTRLFGHNRGKLLDFRLQSTQRVGPVVVCSSSTLIALLFTIREPGVFFIGLPLR